MKIDKDALKKQVILHLPYLLFLLVFAKLGEAVRLAPGADASQKLLGLSEGFALAFQSMWPGAALDWLVGLCGAAAVRLAVYLKGKDAKKYRKNVEYGSARWGNKTDIAPFMDPKPENNVILTQSEGLMLNGRPKNPAHARNKNVLVVGGSGSGKTRFFIKPNLMQMHSSYVVTDPKGTVLVECGKMLQRGTPKLDKDGKPQEVLAQSLLSYEELIKLLNEKNEPVLFIGDGVVPAKQAFEEGLTCAYKIAPAHICTQRAGSVALAAKDMAEAGEVILSDAFHPEYLRPSQAERELKRGTVSNS